MVGFGQLISGVGRSSGVVDNGQVRPLGQDRGGV
jgi:hypothetical protein